MWIELILSHSGNKQLVEIDSIVTIREASKSNVSTEVFVKGLNLAVEYLSHYPETEQYEIEIIQSDTPYHELKFLMLAAQKQQKVEKKKSAILGV